ncbi:MAG: PucR family transcriptional regulator ligand-binding domain-containing protein [Bacillota bacterium]|nr:PucR family transcriptional regulator ligand-binding domain-containing protein [Bacillota bacterium]
MSVTVSDLLNLPSLRQATVVAGKKGLNKIVSSISVLETTDTSYLVDGLFQQGEFFGSEIVITGFLNCIDDVDCQCDNIRRLAEGGEIGLILFYVGVYMPRIDKRLIDLANELDFVLIQMPKSKNLRYGEVISDVSEYIHNDRAKNDFIVSDILARVSRLPEHQRTINTVLRMVSDGIMASVLLTDNSMNLINIAAWPQNVEPEIKSNLAKIIQLVKSGDSLKDTNIYLFPIVPDDNHPMNLLLIKEGATLSTMLQSQVTDIVRISLNIWGKNHGNIALHELFRAILQDDPLKMRRLADIFHITISDIHELWVLSGTGESSENLLRNNIKNVYSHVNSCCKIVVSDIYEGKLLVFASTPNSENDAERQVEEILEDMRKIDDSITLAKFSNLQNTTEVRNAYLDYQNHLEEAKQIFPLRLWFSEGEITFAKECSNIIRRGEKSIAPYNLILKRLLAKSHDCDVIETFGTYALDADYSVTKTAKLLHIHNNTVKYRLKVLDDSLGYKHDKIPDSIKLYYSVALHRLLNADAPPES